MLSFGSGGNPESASRAPGTPGTAGVVGGVLMLCCGLGGNPDGRDLNRVSDAPAGTVEGPVPGCRSVAIDFSTLPETGPLCNGLPAAVAAVDTVELSAVPLTWSVPGLSRPGGLWPREDAPLPERLRTRADSAATLAWASACSCSDTSSIGVSPSEPGSEDVARRPGTSPRGDSRDLPRPFFASLPSGSGRRNTLSPSLTGPGTVPPKLLSPPETPSAPWEALNSSKQEKPFTRAKVSRAISTN